MEKLTSIKGAIFDLDGTLFDSLWVWEEVDRRFLAQRGIPLPADYFDVVQPMEFSQAAQYTIERFSLPDSPEGLIAEWQDLARLAYAQEVRLKPGAADFLQLLVRRGVKIAAATSCARELFEPALWHNGVYGLFSTLVTTAEAGESKGTPAVYRRAAKRLSLQPEECVVFEDILSGIRSARKGGFRTVAVWDPRSGNWPELCREADAAAKAFAQLLPLFA